PTIGVTVTLRPAPSTSRIMRLQSRRRRPTFGRQPMLFPVTMPRHTWFLCTNRHSARTATDVTTRSPTGSMEGWWPSADTFDGHGDARAAPPWRERVEQGEPLHGMG